MTGSIADSTLERFREAAASGHPTPAGVAIAAVSAGFAFGLLAKAAAVSGRKSALPDERAQLESIAVAARAQSSRMLQLADEDMQAFAAYLAGARMPQSSEPERMERRRALDAALRQAIDLPLAAARSAACGLQLCADAVTLTRPAVLADLASAVTLLSGALRAFLLCAQSNVAQLSPEGSADRGLLAQEIHGHQPVLHQAGEVLERVAATFEAARGRP